MLGFFLSELSEENIEWFYHINWGLDNPIFDFIMPIITIMGSLYGWIIFSMVIYLFGGKFGRKVAILALIALFFSNVIVIVLKSVVGEPRPFLTLPNVDLLVSADGESFPSGHTASAFAAATVIGLKYYLESEGRLRWLIYPLMVLAFLVGFSRIYIGVHYPYDVVIGALIGTICALAVLKYQNKLLDNRISRLITLPKEN
jgi:undecaprenyl-diphosphatase